MLLSSSANAYSASGYHMKVSSSTSAESRLNGRFDASLSKRFFCPLLRTPFELSFPNLVPGPAQQQKDRIHYRNMIELKNESNEGIQQPWGTRRIKNSE